MTTFKSIDCNVAMTFILNINNNNNNYTIKINKSFNCCSQIYEHKNYITVTSFLSWYKYQASVKNAENFVLIPDKTLKNLQVAAFTFT